MPKNEVGSHRSQRVVPLADRRCSHDPEIVAGVEGIIWGYAGAKRQEGAL